MCLCESDGKSVSSLAQAKLPLDLRWHLLTIFPATRLFLPACTHTHMSAHGHTRAHGSGGEEREKNVCVTL